jgi:hypothetical protein
VVGVNTPVASVPAQNLKKIQTIIIMALCRFVNLTFDQSKEGITLDWFGEV